MTRKLNIHREVTPQGWRLDRDHWYTRQVRDGDAQFDDCMIGFTEDGKVYLRSAQNCLDYDAGKIKGGKR